jgi:transposase
MASVEVLAGPERRRRWSIEQKQSIVAAAFEPGAVVREVARRCDVTASLIYRWRRDLRAGVVQNQPFLGHRGRTNLSWPIGPG